MGKERLLASLLEGCGAGVTGGDGVVARGVAYDSRRVRPGDVFVAIPGFRHDGLEFVPQAIAAGAVAIVAETDPIAEAGDVAWARVPSARAALARVACAWFDHPSRALTVLGVTGTNGKTTVTAMLDALLSTRGQVGRWSTTTVRYGDVRRDAVRTTPESLDLQEALADMLSAGCEFAVLEVSSHALELERVTGIGFAGAAFTNLSPDHLDFHTGMDDYLDAKARLFEDLPPGAPAAINLSDPAGRALAERTGGRVVGYGWAADDDTIEYRIESCEASDGDTEILLACPLGRLTVRTPLVGRANAENVAAGMALALEVGVEPAAALRALAAFRGEPGRLEPVEAGQPFRVLVDFAHTPGALEAALEAGRAASGEDGRLIVVFGCGGDRDRSKRPLMGAIAARLADHAIVTSDNPRSESPQAIIDEILAGVPEGDRAGIEVEADRARAIGRAVALAGPDDCVLIAGKGHERDQTFADRTIPFDDREVARAAIDAQAATAGGAT